VAVLRRLVWVALCAGVLSGLFATIAHQIGTVPVILKAETYEKAAEHSQAQAHEQAVAWEPQSGVERAAYTLLADVLTAIGFALLLAAGLTLRGGAVGWRDGVFWGLAGFAALTIAPGLGLPPELPGTEAAPLLGRQLWWLATVVSTGSGLALLVFNQRAHWAILAAILIVLPHLYGAPRLAEHAVSVTPEALSRKFVVAVTIVSFLFWLVLGASTGYFYSRFHRPEGV
jgi:cobalt transporter subunit CbtA